MPKEFEFELSRLALDYDLQCTWELFENCKVYKMLLQDKILIDLNDYSFFTQWPRFRVKHLVEFVRSKTELQPCY